MTSRPELKLGRHLLPGLVAVLLFVVMAFVFIQTPFAESEGFPAETQVANVSVAEAGANVTIEDRADGIYAVADGGNGGGTLVTPYADASVDIVTRGGTIYAVATIPTSITESLGYALFSLDNSRQGVPSEGFLLPFETIDVVLVAALVAAVMLARRESGATLQTALGGTGEGENEDIDGDVNVDVDVDAAVDDEANVATDGGDDGGEA